MVKRINQRTVSKKTLESLAYAGAFDCFPQLHRAQYFFCTPGDTITGLEKIIRFGNVVQAQNVQHSNTLVWRIIMQDMKCSLRKLQTVNNGR